MGTTSNFVFVIVRYVLAIIGSALVTRGVMSQEQADTFVGEFAQMAAGAVLVGLPLLWAYIKEQRQKQRLNTALGSTEPMTANELDAQIKQGVSAPANVPSNIVPTVTVDVK